MKPGQQGEHHEHHHDAGRGPRQRWATGDAAAAAEAARALESLCALDELAAARDAVAQRRMVKAAEVLMVVAVLMAGFSAFSAHAQAIKGMKFEPFVKAFNAHAKFDNEHELALRSCQSKPVPGKPLQAWTCSTGTSIYAHGLAGADGVMRDAAVVGQPTSSSEFNQFRISARYLVRTAKGGLPMGDGLHVMEVMSLASKSPGSMVSVARDGIKINAVKSPDEWMISVQPE